LPSILGRGQIAQLEERLLEKVPRSFPREDFLCGKWAASKGETRVADGEGGVAEERFMIYLDVSHANAPAPKGQKRRSASISSKRREILSDARLAKSF